MAIHGGLPSVWSAQKDESARGWDESAAARKPLGRTGQIQGRIGGATEAESTASALTEPAAACRAARTHASPVAAAWRVDLTDRGGRITVIDDGLRPGVFRPRRRPARGFSVGTALTRRGVPGIPRIELRQA